MRKTSGALLLAAGLVLGTAGIAGAGEYNGNGGYVPGGDTGKSACSYSGRDLPDGTDEGEENNPFPFLDDDWVTDGHVQTFGRYMKAKVEMSPDDHPGVACRGNAGGEH